MKRSVLLAGDYMTTSSLAFSLSQKGCQVKVINNDKDDCKKLAESGRIEVYYGDATRPYVLEDAMVEDMDMAIALTPRDEDNLVICELCKKKFHVKKTVSILNDSKKTEFFYHMGIDLVVCATNMIASIIEQQAFMDDISMMIPLKEGKLTIAEVPITQTSVAAGKKLYELDLPQQVIIGCILRNEQSMIPRGDSRIMAGDILVLISGHDQELEAIHELTGR